MIQTGLKTKNKEVQTVQIEGVEGAITSFGHISDSAEYLVDHQTGQSTNMNSTQGIPPTHVDLHGRPRVQSATRFGDVKAMMSMSAGMMLSRISIITRRKQGHLYMFRSVHNNA